MVVRPHHLLLLCVAVLSACGAGTSEKDQFAAAQRHFETKEYAPALVELKNVLAQDPDSAPARYLLGRVLDRSGICQLAEPEFRRAIDLNHEVSASYLAIARCLVDTGRYRAAIDEFAAKNLENPTATAELRGTIALAHARNGDRDKAQAALAQALALNPDDVKAQILKIRLDIPAQPLEVSEQRVAALVDKYPKSYEVGLLAGDVTIALRQDFGAALEAYKRALAIDPESVDARAGVIDALLLLNRKDEALNEIDELWRFHPGQGDALYFKIQGLYMRGKYDQAAEEAQRLMLATRDNTRVMRLAALIELKRNANSKAGVLLGKALRANPADVSTRNLLAYTYLRAGAPAKALEVLANAIVGDQAGAAALAQAGQAYLQLGDNAKAEDALRRAAKLKASSVEIKATLALAQIAQGRNETGLASLQELATSDAGAQADMMLIAELSKAGRLEEALGAIDRLEKKQTTSPVPPFLRGKTLAALDRIDDARKSFQAAVAKDAGYLAARVALADIDLSHAQIDRALEGYEGVLKTDPSNIASLTGVLKALRFQGATDQAIKERLERAVMEAPDQVEINLALISHRAQKRDFSGAIAAAQAALAKTPDAPDYLMAIGELYGATGDLQQANAALTKVAAQRPESVEPLLALAHVHDINKQPDRAESLLRRAMTLAPDSAAARRKLAELLLRRGQRDKALQVARDAQKALPKSASGFLLEGDILAQKRQWAEMATVLRKAVGLAQPGVAPQRLHFALLASKATAEADQFARSWQTSHPNDVSFLFYLGSREMAAGRLDRAEALFESVAKLEPANALAWNNIAWLRLQRGAANAADAADKARRLAPFEPAVLDTAAQALTQAGQLAPAQAAAEMAVRLVPESLPFKLTLATVHAKAGHKERAEPLLDDILARKPGNELRDAVVALRKSMR